ncbi:MAG: DNA polymerase III subunit beta [Treponema sp.]|jgi:DNA polymerase-3 subunit beta|nr:DNA polymerase III subunit beta [Treponema sp.]
MKFTCERSVLLKEVAIANEIIGSQNTTSILSNMYLEAANDSLKIKATDNKVNFETTVPVEVVEPGSVTVLGGKFCGILNTIPDGELEFEQADSKVLIKMPSKRVKYQLNSVTSEKFPDFPDAGEDVFAVPAAEIKDMITNVIFAVSDDETRYFMNGVFFEKEENFLIMVATDGRRLSLIKKELAQGIKDFKPVIIPPKILEVVRKRAGDEGEISLSLTERNIFISFGSYKLSSVLIEGNFPNYRRVIPEDQTLYFKVDRQELLDALKTVSPMMESKSHRIFFELSQDTISVYSTESEIGEARKEISCEYSGENISLSFNCRYIDEPLRPMESEEVVVRFTDNSKAITMKPEPESDYFHIVMPMQPQQY